MMTATGIGGINIDLWITRMASMIAEAPEELRIVLTQIKMVKTKRDALKALGSTNINVEMLAKTLAYLQDSLMTDESITRLLKEGKKKMII